MSIKSEQMYNVQVGNYFPSRTTESNALIEALLKEGGGEILDFISSQFSLQKLERILFVSQSEKLYNQVDYNNIQAIINLQPVNNNSNINQLFASINKLLPDAGFYIGCVETYNIRKENIIKKYGKTLSHPIWFADFLFNRVMPRVKTTKKLHSYLTGNKHTVISLAETLGRLVYSGFEIIEDKRIGNHVYFVALKTGNPKTDNHVSNGLFFPMKRIGKGGKIIKVYKVRTMHPYSEFLQDYILKINGYNELGKPANDFRLARWGVLLRKLWLDEIPQLLNVLKGEMAIVGVRPLSQVRYNQFPDDLKAERIKYRPGCIPPYVALCMPDAKGNIEAERIYLNDMKKHPLLTNIIYFFKAVYNIATNKIRSS
jgi:hypothetical protein